MQVESGSGKKSTDKISGMENEREISLDLLVQQCSIQNIIFFDLQSPVFRIYEKYIAMLENLRSEDPDVMNERAQLLSSLCSNRDASAILDEDELRKNMERVLYLVKGITHGDRLDRAIS